MTRYGRKGRHKAAHRQQILADTAIPIRRRPTLTSDTRDAAITEMPMRTTGALADSR